MQRMYTYQASYFEILRDRAHLGWNGAQRDLAETQSANPRGAVGVEDRLDRGAEQVFCGARR